MWGGLLGSAPPGGNKSPVATSNWSVTAAGTYAAVAGRERRTSSLRIHRCRQSSEPVCAAHQCRLGLTHPQGVRSRPARMTAIGCGHCMSDPVPISTSSCNHERFRLRPLALSWRSWSLGSNYSPLRVLSGLCGEAVIFLGVLRVLRGKALAERFVKPRSPAAALGTKSD